MCFFVTRFFGNLINKNLIGGKKRERLIVIVVSNAIKWNNRLLLCKRSGISAFSGTWEFPTVELEDDETIEDSAERGIFECLSVQVLDCRRVGGVNMMGTPEHRIMVCKTEIASRKLELRGYCRYKWVCPYDLYHTRLSPVAFSVASVTKIFD